MFISRKEKILFGKKASLLFNAIVFSLKTLSVTARHVGCLFFVAKTTLRCTTLPLPPLYGRMTALQASAVLSFMFVAAWAAACGRGWAALVLTVNAGTSAVAHRSGRSQATDLSDVADRLAIAVWIFTNLLLAWPVPLARTAVGLAFAGTCAVLNHSRLQLRWGCGRRVLLHAAMHACGALGTAVLISGASSENKKQQIMC